MEAVRSVHIPWLKLPDAVLQAMRTEMRRYSHVFTTNYDLLCYWAIMCEGHAWPFKDFFWNECADGGSWTCFDPENTEVVVSATEVVYLHGAMHLVELPWGETAKLTLTPESGSLLDQFAVPDPDDKYPVVPLVITEGSSSDKMDAIRRSDYLSFGYDLLGRTAGSLTIFGHSLGDQDVHLVAGVARSDPDRSIAVSIRPGQDDDIVERKLQLMQAFPKASLTFFDATSHPLGHADMAVSLAGTG